MARLVHELLQTGKSQQNLAAVKKYILYGGQQYY